MSLNVQWVQPGQYTRGNYGLGYSGALLTAQYFQQRLRAGELTDTITFTYSHAKNTCFEKEAQERSIDALAAGHVYSGAYGLEKPEEIATEINLQDGIFSYATYYANQLQAEGEISAANELRTFLVNELDFLSNTKKHRVESWTVAKYDTTLGHDGKITPLEAQLTEAILSGTKVSKLAESGFQHVNVQEMSDQLHQYSSQALDFNTQSIGAEVLFGNQKKLATLLTFKKFLAFLTHLLELRVRA